MNGHDVDTEVRQIETGEELCEFVMMHRMHEHFSIYIENGLINVRCFEPAEVDLRIFDDFDDDPSQSIDPYNDDA